MIDQLQRDMMSVFYKYESLGNHFVIFDLIHRSPCMVEALLSALWWPWFVQKMCDVRSGCGADTLLIIGYRAGIPNVYVFNKDGTAAENCLNGVRCVAAHIMTEHGCFESIDLFIGRSRLSFMLRDGIIKTTGIRAGHVDMVSISCGHRSFEGFTVNVGNPHFVIFHREEPAAISTWGSLIERHEQFPQRTNVEWIWPAGEGCYQMLIYERGVGVTAACSSGAAAAIWVLYSRGLIDVNVSHSIVMPGGAVIAKIEPDMSISLQASASFVYKGVMSSSWIDKMCLDAAQRIKFLDGE